MAVFSLPWPHLAAAIVVTLITYQVTNAYLQYKRLAHVRGPLLAAVTPLWLVYHTLKGDLYLAMQKNIEIYGSPLRIGPNTIVCNDPDVIRQVNAPKAPFIRGHWFRGMKFDPRTDNLLSVRDEDQHAVMRRNMIPGYTGSEVPTLEDDVSDRVTELVQSIRQYIVKDKPFDFAQLAHYFTLDILTKIAFGKPLGYLTQDKDIYDYISLNEAFYPVMELQTNCPSVYNFFHSSLMSGALPKPTDKNGFGRLMGHAHSVVAARLAEGAEHQPDIIGSFIKHGLNRTELESESILVILAGADSTATSLRTTLYYIVTNPRVYHKLVSEIKAATPSRPVITNQEAQALPYLRATILESLRMFMPLQGIASRNTPKGGSVVAGVFVPEGTEFGFAWQSMLHRKDIFGHDADTYRPERWIEGDPSDIRSMEKVQELVFGAGRSSCLGKSIAWMELRKTIFELLYAFDISLVNALQPMTTRVNGIVVQKNFVARAYARTSA